VGKKQPGVRGAGARLKLEGAQAGLANSKTRVPKSRGKGVSRKKPGFPQRGGQWFEKVAGRLTHSHSPS